MILCLFICFFQLGEFLYWKINADKKKKKKKVHLNTEAGEKPHGHKLIHHSPQGDISWHLPVKYFQDLE